MTPTDTTESIAPILARVTEKLTHPDARLLAWQAEAEREEQGRAAERQRTRMVAMGIPSRYRTATLDDGDPRPALERIRSYIGEEYPRGRALVLAGPTGTGKTYAAIAGLRAIDTGRLWYFPALCGALLDPGQRADTLAEVKRMPFLVLDDLGTEYAKDGGLVQAFLDEIVWTREAEERATVITTNLTTEQIQTRLSDRIVDRLRWWGSVYSVTGESLRGAPR